MIRDGARAVFVACCLVVAGVSVHDAVLVILNDKVIADMEQNPIGQWLIHSQAGDVRLFVLLKLAGTAAACTILILIFERRRRLGVTVAAVLASLQLVLLVYLSLA